MPQQEKSLIQLSHLLYFLGEFGLTEKEISRLSDEGFAIDIKCILTGLKTVPASISIPETQERITVEGILDAYYTHERGKFWDPSILLLTDFREKLGLEYIADVIRTQGTNHWLGFNHLFFLLSHSFLIWKHLQAGKKITFPAALKTENGKKEVFYLQKHAEGNQVILLRKSIESTLHHNELLAYYR